MKGPRKIGPVQKKTTLQYLSSHRWHEQQLSVLDRLSKINIVVPTEKQASSFAAVPSAETYPKILIEIIAIMRCLI